jgi:phosphoribosylaminoimidazole-succinocarboxamide synthase
MTGRELLYKGKAKTIFRSEIPGELVVSFRDDITAFNGEKKDQLSGKGAYNAVVSAFFFEYLLEKGIESHFIRMIDDVTMVVHELTMIPIEVIVRNKAAGSIVRRYPFSEGKDLNPPVILMDYKDDDRHDPMLNDDLIIALDLLSQEELAAVKQTSLEINRHLKEYFATLGIDLVDFKIEFGRVDDEIILGDEISMDSMRLWDRETGESLDKDVYRFDKGNLLAAYARVAGKIVPDHFGGRQ